MRQARYRFIVVLILLLFAGLALKAQQNSEIVGTVTDQTGAAVPGASLTLTQKETGFVYNISQQRHGRIRICRLERRHLRPEGRGEGV